MSGEVVGGVSPLAVRAAWGSVGSYLGPGRGTTRRWPRPLCVRHVRVLALAVVLAAAGCADSRGAAAGAAPRDTVPRTPEDSALAAARAATARLQQLCRSDSAIGRYAARLAPAADTTRVPRRAGDTLASVPVAASATRPAGIAEAPESTADTIPETGRTMSGLAEPRPRTAPAASGSSTATAPPPPAWLGPVARRAVTQVPLPGSLFPGCRVVAYYGNPLSRRMGILGEIAPDSMLARLQRQAEAYARADSTTPVLPALELIATVAQGSAGRDGMYRARMPDSLIERVAGWADRAGYLLILDIQVGRSSVARELRPLLPYLARPNVHLALDPEFAMRPGAVPGRVIGTLDARDVNLVIDTLAKLVADHELPPKMLIVHRFTRPMLTNHEQIRLDPRVQVVIDMDGFGRPWLKRHSYRAYVHDHPVQFAGFKLFYKNDKPLLTPQEVLSLIPVPVFVMYQ